VSGLKAENNLLQQKQHFIRSLRKLVVKCF